MGNAIIYIAGILGSLSVICATIYAAIKFISKPLLNFIEETKETNKLHSKALTACLHGLHDDLKCNGPVTEALNEMDKFLLDKAYK